MNNVQLTMITDLQTEFFLSEPVWEIKIVVYAFGNSCSNSFYTLLFISVNIYIYICKIARVSKSSEEESHVSITVY